jgi:hypothetical protein
VEELESAHESAWRVEVEVEGLDITRIVHGSGLERMK